MNKWEIMSAVTTAIGVSYHYESAASMTKRRYSTYTTAKSYDQDSIYPLDTTGYTRLIRVYSDTAVSPNMQEYVTINPDTKRLVLHSGSGALTLSLEDYDRELAKKYTGTENINLDQKDLTFRMSTGSTEMKVVLQNYVIPNPRYTHSQTPDIA